MRLSRRTSPSDGSRRSYACAYHALCARSQPQRRESKMPGLGLLADGAMGCLIRHGVGQPLACPTLVGCAHASSQYMWQRLSGRGIRDYHTPPPPPQERCANSGVAGQPMHRGSGGLCARPRSSTTRTSSARRLRRAMWLQQGCRLRAVRQAHRRCAPCGVQASFEGRGRRAVGGEAEQEGRSLAPR